MSVSTARLPYKKPILIVRLNSKLGVALIYLINPHNVNKNRKYIVHIVKIINEYIDSNPCTKKGESAA